LMDPIRFGHLKTSHPSLYEALKVLDEGFEKKHADGHTENELSEQDLYVAAGDYPELPKKLRATVNHATTEAMRKAIELVDYQHTSLASEAKQRAISAMIKHANQNDGYDARRAVKAISERDTITPALGDVLETLAATAASENGLNENAALKALLGADTISDNHAKVLKAIITHTSSANNLNSDRAIKLCLQVDDITNAATKILIDVVSSASATDGLDSNKLFRHFLTFEG